MEIKQIFTRFKRTEASITVFCTFNKEIEDVLSAVVLCFVDDLGSKGIIF